MREKYDKPLILFRCWGLSKTFNTEEYYLENANCGLQSLATNNVWRTVAHKAHCPFTHEAPRDKCVCGMNGLFCLPEEKVLGKSEFIVWGAFAGVGKTEIHSRGARTEAAQVLALFCPEAKSDNRFHTFHLQILSRCYAVPVFEDRDEFHSYLSRYGMIYNQDPIRDRKELEHNIGFRL